MLVAGNSKMGCIYKITNTVNGKSYIGQTRHDVEKTRIRKHLNGSGNRIIKQTAAKYGEDAFVFEILHDGIIPEFLDDLERKAIAKFNTLSPHGYNLTDGGGGGTHSEESRRKMSEAHKGEKNHNFGKSHSEEHRRKMSQAHKGKKMSAESRRKMSENNSMRNNPETRIKNAEAQRGRKHSEETKRKMSENNAMQRPEVRQKVSNTLKGRKRPAETCRKISENCSMKHPEVRQKVSEAKRSPYYNPARRVFYGLPETLTLQEKRKILFSQFTEVTKRTIYNWVGKWTSIS